MMPTFVGSDADGFVCDVLTHEGPYLPVTDRVAVPSERDAVAATDAIAARWTGERFEVARDDRAVWRVLRARGIPSDEHDEFMAAVRRARRIVPHDLDPSVLLPIPAPHPTAMLGGLEGVFPAVSGLAWRPMSSLDLDAVAAVGVEAGFYRASCDADCGCQPPEAHAWLMMARRMDRADGWQMCLEFEGQPIQYELIRREARDLATIAVTMHMNRERPHWFWYEAELPVLRALKAIGIARLKSFARKDRPDWVQALKDNYNAWQVAEHEKTIELEYPLEALAARASSWPQRRVLGFDQVRGSVRVWEASAADLPAIRDLITQIPGAQRQVAARVLREWWTLDRATLLLGARNGELRYVRAIRPRRGGTAGLAMLAPLFDDPEQADVTALVKAWCRQATYSRVTTFVQEAQLANPRVQYLMTITGMVEVGRRAFAIPMVEMGVDL